jgi:hypothetical protein
LAQDAAQQRISMAHAIGVISQHYDTSTSAGYQYRYIPWLHPQCDILKSKIQITGLSTVNYRDLVGHRILENDLVAHICDIEDDLSYCCVAKDHLFRCNDVPVDGTWRLVQV